jgi:hypothetical protein
VAIHNWVRNSIEWVPTWGAIQCAEDTLSKKRGNAHDIASLEVALLRAANILARYQYGTIELDAEKAQNWVGGVSVPQAALQLLGQGGIANKGIVAGGKIDLVQPGDALDGLAGHDTGIGLDEFVEPSRLKTPVGDSSATKFSSW